MVVLDQLLAFSTWWPTPGVVLDARLAPEFVWLWVLVLALVAWRGALSARLTTALTIGYLALILGRYLDVTVPSMFGRPLNLFWDIPQLPRGLWVWAQGQPLALVAALLAGAVLGLWALQRLVRACLGVLACHAAPYALRTRWTWGVTAVCVALVVANHAGVQATWPMVSKPVVPTYWRQAQVLTAAFFSPAQTVVLPPSTAMDAARARPKGQSLAALKGRDVYVIMLESYGAVVYDDARAKTPMARKREAFATDLAAGGHQVVSAFVRSPTFAGASDLAHLSLLSGIDLQDPMRHDVLLTTQRPTLITLFREQGWRTVGLYPALSWAWPESRFYGYDALVDGPMLDWRGPKLGYWHLPDAYSLAKFEALNPRDAQTPPRFVFFPTITTHLPFSPVPPHQGNLARLLGPTPFETPDVERALAAKPNWLNMFPDYLAMVDYLYTWLGAHFKRGDAREAIYVLVGDHQPAANVTGEGASWDVPVHIVSRDASLLAKFEAQGFAPGLEPPRRALGGLHDLTAMLLAAFAGEAP